MGKQRMPYIKTNWVHGNTIFLEPAYKCNMTDIMAGIGLAQLKRYPKMLSRRHEIIKKYENSLKNNNITLLKHINEELENISSGHLFIIRMNNISEQIRNEIIVKMAERGIATNVHYKPSANANCL